MVGAGCYYVKWVTPALCSVSKISIFICQSFLGWGSSKGISFWLQGGTIQKSNSEKMDKQAHKQTSKLFTLRYPVGIHFKWDSMCIKGA